MTSNTWRGEIVVRLPPALPGEKGYAIISPATTETTAARVPLNLSTLATEILLLIFYHLEYQKDRSYLIRTCRTLSLALTGELYKYDAQKCDHHALGWACLYGHEKLLRDLLKRNRCDHSHTFRHYIHQSALAHRKYNGLAGPGATPLSLAILGSHPACVKLLLERGGADPSQTEVRESLSAPTRHYRPIDFAITLRTPASMAIIKLLGDHGAWKNQHGELVDPIFQVLTLERPRRSRAGNHSCAEFNRDLWSLWTHKNKQLKALLASGGNPNVKHPNGGLSPVFYLLNQFDQWKPHFYFYGIHPFISATEEEEQVVIANRVHKNISI
ncbi:hypothetical protein F5Y18DRAFT_313625 [Xylariaceae sp. FL1019]|nr:hypothetical protein F5Y18DRAFT_313625 [Xylariaceae sp. FL1019]